MIETPDLDAVKAYFTQLQTNICEALEQEDGDGTFIKDAWQRPEGGGGLTRVLANGACIEKGGVNFSHVFGNNMPASATANNPQWAGCSFDAMGVSLVIHPRNPYVPTSHANVRFFRIKDPDGSYQWWFGGGYDLTPYYLFEEDAVHWHQVAHQACEPFGQTLYADYKQQCDDYFYLPHRQETRGIGGLFFDHVNEGGFSRCFDLVRSVGDSYIDAYLPIVNRRKNTPYTTDDVEYQQYRRGRYTEFNLIYDRGTLFGLQSNGRTESILMSMPPTAKWAYQWTPQNNPQADALLAVLKAPKQWL